MTVSYETANVLQPFAYGRGYPTLKKVTTPAAGATASLPVPGSRVFRLLSVQATLTTSAAVANRVPTLQFLDGDGGEWLRIPGQGSQAASLTDVWTWCAGVGAEYTSAAGGQVLPLPDLLVPSGFSVTLNVVNIDVADQLSVVRAFVEEFPIGGQGYPVGVTLAEPAYPQ